MNTVKILLLGLDRIDCSEARAPQGRNLIAAGHRAWMSFEAVLRGSQWAISYSPLLFMSRFYANNFFRSLLDGFA